MGTTQKLGETNWEERENLRVRIQNSESGDYPGGFNLSQSQFRSGLVYRTILWQGEIGALG
jgi:hypothetical protein